MKMMIALCAVLLTTSAQAEYVTKHERHDVLMADDSEVQYETYIDRVFPSRGRIYIRVTDAPALQTGLEDCLVHPTDGPGHWLVLDGVSDRENEYLFEIAYGHMLKGWKVRVFVRKKPVLVDGTCGATRLLVQGLITPAVSAEAEESQ